MNKNASMHKKTSIVQNRAFYRILVYLASHFEAAQYDLKGLLGHKHETISRELKKLNKIGMVYLQRKEHSSKGGRDSDKNIWRITFKGLIAIICWHFTLIHISDGVSKFVDNPNYNLEAIIESQRERWLIFKEWDYIKRNLERQNEVWMLIKMHFKDYVFSDLVAFNRAYNELADTAEKLSEEERLASIVFEEKYYLIEATRVALLIDHYLKVGVLDNSNGYLRQFDSLLDNSSLREWIKNHIIYIKQNYLILDEISEQIKTVEKKQSM